MEPGEIVTGDNGMSFQIGSMLSYQGKAECDYGGCRRIPGEPGCMGYHCPTCHAPVSMMGHDCPEAIANSQEKACQKPGCATPAGEFCSQSATVGYCLWNPKPDGGQPS